MDRPIGQDQRKRDSLHLVSDSWFVVRSFEVLTGRDKKGTGVLDISRHKQEVLHRWTKTTQNTFKNLKGTLCLYNIYITRDIKGKMCLMFST